MYREGKLESYVEDAASNKPAPGGGSVSGLVGALAAAMSEMSANFTVGKKKFAAVQDAVRQMLQELAACRDALLALMDRDVEAYGAVNQAYSMPKDTGPQKAARKGAMDSALRGAMEAPLQVMRQCAGVSAIADRLVDIGNPNLITDVGVSAILAEAACASARLNVEINLKFLRAPELTEKTTAEMNGLSQQVQECRIRVAEKVGAYLKS
ncbi:MAG: cyclodeaminase/cyclohydrolase family protein [Candidatus Brocadiae bacterium]|nr:cyclodeaminase/cyclohydrolase family protein [Candidatus Brocadiia bacterium]